MFSGLLWEGGLMYILMWGEQGRGKSNALLMLLDMSLI